MNGNPEALSKDHASWVKQERARLQRDVDYESSRLQEANAALIEAERRYGEATRALDGFNKGYGR